MFANSFPIVVRVIEILFFTGLVGCAFVVAVSWISIFRDGFTRGSKEERYNSR